MDDRQVAELGREEERRHAGGGRLRGVGLGRQQHKDDASHSLLAKQLEEALRQLQATVY